MLSNHYFILNNNVCEQNTNKHNLTKTILGSENMSVGCIIWFTHSLKADKINLWYEKSDAVFFG